MDSSFWDGGGGHSYPPNPLLEKRTQVETHLCACVCQCVYRPENSFEVHLLGAQHIGTETGSLTAYGYLASESKRDDRILQQLDFYMDSVDGTQVLVHKL